MKLNISYWQIPKLTQLATSVKWKASSSRNCLGRLSYDLVSKKGQIMSKKKIRKKNHSIKSILKKFKERYSLLPSLDWKMRLMTRKTRELENQMIGCTSTSWTCSWKRSQSGNWKKWRGNSIIRKLEYRKCCRSYARLTTIPKNTRFRSSTCHSDDHFLIHEIS